MSSNQVKRLVLGLLTFLLCLEQSLSFLSVCPSNKAFVVPKTKTCKIDEHKYSYKISPTLSTSNYKSQPLSSLEMSSNGADPTGQKRGLILFSLVLLLNTWLFTIPPEFRRARICTEQQAIDYQIKKCTTPKGWINGVTEYYKNGGGIKFDFTIDPDSKL